MENDVQLQNIILLIKKTSLETRLGFKKGLFLLLNLKTTSFWSLMKYAKGKQTTCITSLPKSHLLINFQNKDYGNFSNISGFCHSHEII